MTVWRINALTQYAMGHLGEGVITGLLMPLLDITYNIEYKLTVIYFAELTVELIIKKEYGSSETEKLEYLQRTDVLFAELIINISQN